MLKHLIRYNHFPLCVGQSVGQKQRWYLLKMQTDDAHIQLDSSESPEFDQWRWVDYWYPYEASYSFQEKSVQKSTDRICAIYFYQLSLK